MKLPIGIAITLSLACFLAGCGTNNAFTPDIQSVQPSQQDQDLAKLSRAINS